ncbi:hypothetical protein THAOC_22405 [Thalassiosira oceanica]|uniref:Uncharacterized protein n=1 Tax=Thalassiosira oceanica TaxID=159749 RepID=K0RYI8_THAOC|nr:hypothetical protein THAOC_22405 [Thalassiosira oceanica]|eukprot:EJK57539.1 hypothetical protein THAOC_22405 [Thalassiosira oceanica]
MNGRKSIASCERNPATVAITPPFLNGQMSICAGRRASGRAQEKSPGNAAYGRAMTHPVRGGRQRTRRGRSHSPSSLSGKAVGSGEAAAETSRTLWNELAEGRGGGGPLPEVCGRGVVGDNPGGPEVREGQTRPPPLRQLDENTRNQRQSDLLAMHSRHVRLDQAAFDEMATRDDTLRGTAGSDRPINDEGARKASKGFGRRPLLCGARSAMPRPTAVQASPVGGHPLRTLRARKRRVLPSRDGGERLDAREGDKQKGGRAGSIRLSEGDPPIASLSGKAAGVTAMEEHIGGRQGRGGGARGSPGARGVPRGSRGAWESGPNGSEDRSYYRSSADEARGIRKLVHFFNGQGRALTTGIPLGYGVTKSRAVARRLVLNRKLEPGEVVGTRRCNSRLGSITTGLARILFGRRYPRSLSGLDNLGKTDHLDTAVKPTLGIPRSRSSRTGNDGLVIPQEPLVDVKREFGGVSFSDVLGDAAAVDGVMGDLRNDRG